MGGCADGGRRTQEAAPHHPHRHCRSGGGAGADCASRPSAAGRSGHCRRPRIAPHDALQRIDDDDDGGDNDDDDDDSASGADVAIDSASPHYTEFIGSSGAGAAGAAGKGGEERPDDDHDAHAEARRDALCQSSCRFDRRSLGALHGARNAL